jgi:flagellar biosynthesis/type III secretory pathway chaperone
MAKLAENLIATLREELSIIENLVEDAHAMRIALTGRDSKAIQKITASRQTAIMRLQMVQHAKTSILKKRNAININRRNVRALTLEMAPHSRELLQKLEDTLVLLHQLNRVNDRILGKQRASVHAYNHLIDMKLGVEQTYDQKGWVQTKHSTFFEQQG